jgi:hypothetical protein
MQSDDHPASAKGNKAVSSHHQRHVLTEPMVVHSNSPNTAPGLLPAGTSLQYVGSLPEGIDRYHVIVNVEGHPLTLEDAPRPVMVDPITALSRTVSNEPPLGPEELYRLLRALDVRRTDLELMLLRWSSDL